MSNIVEKEIDGVLYKAAFVDVAYAESLDEQFRNSKSSLSLGRKLFKDVLISPKVDIDDFDDMESYTRVRDFLLEVARGDFQRETRNSKLKQKVRSQWSMWRLVYCDLANFTYDEVFHKMTPQEIEEANIALDMVQAELKKNMKKK